jgi:fructokinase
VRTRPVVVGVGEVLWDVLPDGEHFGGAPANVAVHAAALGAESWLVSAVGRDARGDAALARLDAAGVRRDTVAQLPDHPTGVVRVALDATGHPVYDIATESAWDNLPWSAAVQQVAERADAIAFGSLAQRSPTARATIRRALTTTRRDAWRLFDVNLRQRYYDADVLADSLDLANAVKLNEEELPVVARLCALAETTPVDQLRALCERFDLRLAALTRGACGSVLAASDRVYESPAAPAVVADTVGAGDAFTATLLIGLLAGRALDEVSRRANAVAAYVCSRPGATPPIPEDLRWTP